MSVSDPRFRSYEDTGPVKSRVRALGERIHEWNGRGFTVECRAPRQSHGSVFSQGGFADGVRGPF
jgi:hypothetical protein